MDIPMEDIQAILQAYPPEQRFSLAMLQDMQHQFNYIPRAGMEALAAYLGCPLSSLYAMTFSSFAIDVMDMIYQFPPMDTMLAAIFGGALLGAGIGLVFAKVLEHAGVYARTPEGKEAFLRFLEQV